MARSTDGSVRVLRDPDFEIDHVRSQTIDLTLYGTHASPFVNAGHARYTIDAARWPKASGLVERVESHRAVAPLLEAEAAAFGG